jgi:hypothetical protein
MDLDSNLLLFSNELQVKKFQVEKLASVRKPNLKSLPLNCYMSQNKTFTINPQTLEKLACTNLKFDLKLVTLAKKFLPHTLNLKLETSRLEEHSSTLEILEHFEEVSFIPPTQLENLQALYILPLGNELPLTLQTKTPSLKKDILFFSMQRNLKITFRSKTMFFLLFGVGP